VADFFELAHETYATAHFNSGCWTCCHLPVALYLFCSYL